MLNIDGKVISMVRKDTGSLSFKVDNYTLTSGDTAYFTVAEEAGMQTPSFQKVVTSFEADGSAQFSISATDSDLEPGTYYYDIQINRADGQIDTVVGPAKFKIIEGVTY